MAKTILFISTGTLDNGAEISIVKSDGISCEKGYRVLNVFLIIKFHLKERVSSKTSERRD